MHQLYVDPGRLGLFDGGLDLPAYRALWPAPSDRQSADHDLERC